MTTSESSIKQAVDQINSSPYKLFVVTSGGGQSFFQHFMQFSGASKTIIGGYIPYNKELFVEFCDRPISKFVCADTAIRLATQAFSKGLKSGHPTDTILGVSITAALQTDGERKGREHTSFIAIHGYYFTMVVKQKFAKGLTRYQEENSTVALLMHILYNITVLNVLEFQIGSDYKLADITIEYVSRTKFAGVEIIPLTEDTVAIYPGSWNPYHEGHNQIAQIAEEIIGSPVIHEITPINADKGFLDWFDVADRISNMQRSHGCSVIVTDYPTFIGKAKSIARKGRQIVFIVGADTWRRVCMPMYVGPIEELYEAFSSLGVKFLPFGRENETIITGTLMDNLLIKSTKALNYNNPISSTTLRIPKE